MSIGASWTMSLRHKLRRSETAVNGVAAHAAMGVIRTIPRPQLARENIRSCNPASPSRIGVGRPIAWRNRPATIRQPFISPHLPGPVPGHDPSPSDPPVAGLRPPRRLAAERPLRRGLRPRLDVPCVPRPPQVGTGHRQGVVVDLPARDDAGKEGGPRRSAPAAAQADGPSARWPPRRLVGVGVVMPAVGVEPTRGFPPGRF
jgi:hypothetical protein